MLSVEESTFRLFSRWYPEETIDNLWGNSDHVPSSRVVEIKPSYRLLRKLGEVKPFAPTLASFWSDVSYINLGFQFVDSWLTYGKDEYMFYGTRVGIFGGGNKPTEGPSKITERFPMLHDAPGFDIIDAVMKVPGEEHEF
ncbi:hypothetical protein BDW74DRAFT_177378 [Aspergillus multicolor]|uniref:uncharacterized protein n=1 Tax=Aspergillus multicolor TaxID=41759 RepID=UPI003CCD1718